MQTPELNQEGDPQDNFVEAKDPAELMMMVVLAAAYLGVAKFCWEPLLLVNNWKMFLNIEGFFGTISIIAMLIGLRPYISPSSLQVSGRGIKYRGPYWPQRKTVNWEQVTQVFVSPELIVILYIPKPEEKRVWPMIVWSMYLADRQCISGAVLRHCPIRPTIMTSPHLVSKIVVMVIFFVLVIWFAEMLVTG